jgi:hypothetical protein
VGAINEVAAIDDLCASDVSILFAYRGEEGFLILPNPVPAGERIDLFD